MGGYLGKIDGLISSRKERIELHIANIIIDLVTELVDRLFRTASSHGTSDIRSCGDPGSPPHALT